MACKAAICETTEPPTSERSALAGTFPAEGGLSVLLDDFSVEHVYYQRSGVDGALVIVGQIALVGGSFRLRRWRRCGYRGSGSTELDADCGPDRLAGSLSEKIVQFPIGLQSLEVERKV